ncbi:MFS transporter [Solicola gregarius]|uniref:MFS transporter n=1 Tax=Solicola gregarius TaxID=2908642 RepID=A0AA46TL75_9ACTN|nr:MFS transporter [Solicola gregarius]UYM06473.1 MFS transporter [Solicola gregarius]
MSEPRAQAAQAIGRLPRVAVTATFAVHALLFASWTAHIPQVKSDLGLTDASLGTALLGAPVGSILATIGVGWLLPRLGSATVVRATLVGYTLAGMTVGMAGSGLTLFAALLLWGAFQGSLDVAMNTQGVTVERTIGRPIMAGLHGAWSIGGFVGAGIGTVGVSVGIALTPQLAVEGLVVLAVVGTLTMRMLPDPESPDEPRGDRKRRTFTPTVLVLGAVAFACMIGEGAAADWSAVYLHDVIDASPTYAGLGFAVFSLAMLTLRLAGNRLMLRFAPRDLLPTCAGVATIGMLVALLVDNQYVALLGFGTLGVGLALVVPTAFSAAGKLGGDSAGSSIATVAAIGWTGFMCGPPLIGHLANAVGLSGALLLLPVLTAAIAIAIRSSSAFDGGVDTR